MNQLNKFIKKFFLERFLEKHIILERNGKYYSSCAYGEEITIELREIFEGD